MDNDELMELIEELKEKIFKDGEDEKDRVEERIKAYLDAMAEIQELIED